RRREDPRLITGRGRYVSDVAPPRLLQVAFVRSAHAHAGLRRVDVAGAVATPGVVAIVTGRDPDVARIRVRARSALRGYVETEQPVLAWPTVHHAGEAIAAVVADHRATAEDAVTRVRVVAPDVGGGFGVKASLYPEDIALCVLAMRLGRPVKWVEQRREAMQASAHARDHHYAVRAGFGRDGRLLAVDVRAACNAGA